MAVDQTVISVFETISLMYSVFSAVFRGRRILAPHPPALVYTSMTGGGSGWFKEHELDVLGLTDDVL